MKRKKALSLLFTFCLTASLINNVVTAEDDVEIVYEDDSYDSYEDDSSSENSDSENSDSSESSESSDSESDTSEEESDPSSDPNYLGEPVYLSNSERQTTPGTTDIDVLGDSDSTINYEVGITTNSIPGWPEGIPISGQSGIVMEESTGTILYAKSMNAPIQPASTVKLMTCLLALEKGNLSDNVVVTATGVSGIVDGGPNVQIQEGEIFTLEQCLYAMIISSANDMALQVAEHIGGSVDNFVQMMNDRAKELGCSDTVFTNPTGSPDPAMHTTAYDMALIVKAGIQNEDFRRITSTLSYTIPATNVSGGERVLTSSLTLINPSSETYCDGCISGKGGYTESSGSTVASAVTRNDCTLITTMFGGAAEGYENEVVSLYTYGYNNFSFLDLAANDFSVLSGGKVIAPVGTTPEQLSSQDTLQSDGSILRTYTYNGAAVGTAIADLSSDGDTGIDTSGTEHMKEAREFTENKSIIPYGVIGAIGLLLVILLIVRIVKIAKSRSY
ncbi:MAG: D-alanyl-D-alanine carboxypeptidase family protein [Eubacteriales bacterium]|nr:D-alanyl-D-alanine carboxypeptidase family protein [Eubacteriales bacterium]